MAEKDMYRRGPSHEEAQEGYLLVEKAKLAFFPPEGEPFELDGREASVESYPCTCRGPEKPHRHWLVRVGGLRQGEVVEVMREGSATYSLRSGA